MGLKIDIEGDSEEAVALALLQMIANAEGKVDKDGELKGVDRSWILETYAQCRAVVEGDDFAMLVEDDEELDEEEEEDEEAQASGADRKLSG